VNREKFGNEIFIDNALLDLSQDIGLLFAVIKNVSLYSEFVPFCVGSRVLDSQQVRFKYDPLYTESELVFYAEITAGFYKLKDAYVSKVTVTHLKSIEAVAVDTNLFRHLKSKWSFQELGNGECLVEFSIDFEFCSQIYAYVANFAFLELAKTTIRAFEHRCVEISSKKGSTICDE